MNSDYQECEALLSHLLRYDNIEEKVAKIVKKIAYREGSFHRPGTWGKPAIDKKDKTKHDFEIDMGRMSFDDYMSAGFKAAERYFSKMISPDFMKEEFKNNYRINDLIAELEKHFTTKKKLNNIHYLNKCLKYSNFIYCLKMNNTICINDDNIDDDNDSNNKDYDKSKEEIWNLMAVNRAYLESVYTRITPRREDKYDLLFHNLDRNVRSECKDYYYQNILGIRRKSFKHIEDAYNIYVNINFKEPSDDALALYLAIYNNYRNQNNESPSLEEFQKHLKAIAIDQNEIKSLVQAEQENIKKYTHRKITFTEIFGQRPEEDDDDNNTEIEEIFDIHKDNYDEAETAVVNTVFINNFLDGMKKEDIRLRLLCWTGAKNYRGGYYEDNSFEDACDKYNKLSKSNIDSSAFKRSIYSLFKNFNLEMLEVDPENAPYFYVVCEECKDAHGKTDWDLVRIIYALGHTGYKHYITLPEWFCRKNNITIKAEDDVLDIRYAIKLFKQLLEQHSNDLYDAILHFKLNHDFRSADEKIKKTRLNEFQKELKRVKINTDKLSFNKRIYLD